MNFFSQGSGSICHLIGHNSNVKRVLRFAYDGGVVTVILRGRHYANGGSGAKLIRNEKHADKNSTIKPSSSMIEAFLCDVYSTFRECNRHLRAWRAENLQTVIAQEFRTYVPIYDDAMEGIVQFQA